MESFGVSFNVAFHRYASSCHVEIQRLHGMRPFLRLSGTSQSTPSFACLLFPNEHLSFTTLARSVILHCAISCATQV